VRPRKGSAAICSRCHQPAPGYDQLSERRFEFIPFWGFLVFLLYSMRRVDCRAVVRPSSSRKCPGGDGKHTLTNAYMLFLARWARRISWKEKTFQQLWDYNSATWAGKFLDEWCCQLVEAGLDSYCVPISDQAIGQRDCG